MAFDTPGSLGAAVLPPPLVCSRKSDGTGVVFVMVNDAPIILEDDGELFPSDALVAKLLVLKP